MTRVKICCISSPEEARTVIHRGGAALGLVSEMPSGPGVISEALIAEVAAVVPPPLATFLLTSRCDAREIIEQQRRCGVNTIQICDRVPSEVYRELAAELPGVSIVQVVHVVDEDSVDEARAIGSLEGVDALLLDSGNQSLEVKELGGTGRTHNWDLSARIVAEVDRPVFLAGGLNADNVGEAIRRVRPFGVDVCSGVRSGGALDDNKLARFMNAVAAVTRD